MTNAERARPAIEKEIRALLPTFVASMAVLLLGSFVIAPTSRMLVIAAFCWGVLALGAHSIGHEYAHRTLPLLLAQPCSRNRMLARKAMVLVPLVLGLTITASVCLGAARFETVRRADGLRTLLVFAPLASVSLAPWLSMLARGTLPGIVFTMAVVGMVMVGGEFAASIRYRFRDRELVEAFKLSLLWSTLLPICLVAAVAAWRQFGRLQAIEGHRNLQMPAWLGSRASSPAADRQLRRRHPFWLLLRKEIHLQQLTFILVAIYIVAWVARWALEHQMPDTPRAPLQPLTLLYFAILSILTGSVASAEERQLGTLPSQLLLPIAAWKQWTIKAATTVVLAVLLGVALPYALYAVIPPHDEPLPLRLWRDLLAVSLLTTLSLYVSSLCGSAVRAMVTSIPVAVGAALYAAETAGLVTDLGYRAIRAATVSETDRVRRLQVMAMQVRSEYAMLLCAGVAMALLLLFAFANHRRGEHRPSFVVIQATALIAAVTLCLALPVLAWR